MRTLDLTRHSADKLAIYDIEGDRLCSWRDALQDCDPFVDGTSGAQGSVRREERPWVVIFNQVMLGWLRPNRPMSAQ